MGDWLDTIGLSRYKDVFEANSIDGLMLAHLSDAMLDQLDVRFELHRRSLALGLTQLMAKQGRTPRRASKRDKVCDWSADKVSVQRCRHCNLRVFSHVCYRMFFFFFFKRWRTGSHRAISTTES